jgi:diacylglycerol kinase family enzyme
MSDQPDTLFIAAGSYASVDQAVEDYEAIKLLYYEVKASDDFDAAVIARDENGKVKIVKKHEQPTRHGAVHGLGWGLAAGAVVALGSRGSRLRVRADGRTFGTNALLVTIGNTRLWAGAVQITHHATAADGLLDVCIFPGRSLLTKLRHLALVFIGRHDRDPEVEYFQVRELHIAARPALPLQVDGEPFGTTPARIQVVPGALRVLVGSGLAPALADARREQIRRATSDPRDG